MVTANLILERDLKLWKHMAEDEKKKTAKAETKLASALEEKAAVLENVEALETKALEAEQEVKRLNKNSQRMKALDEETHRGWEELEGLKAELTILQEKMASKEKRLRDVSDEKMALWTKRKERKITHPTTVMPAESSNTNHVNVITSSPIPDLADGIVADNSKYDPFDWLI
jgi:predicted  nucleic acid-binding Zn-ribbon protein